MINKLAQVSTAIIFMLAGGGALGSEAPEMAPVGTLPEHSLFFWFSYLSPHEFGGVLSKVGVEVPSFVSGRPPSVDSPLGLKDSILPSSPAEYEESVRFLVTQPVLWGCYVNRAPTILLGPSNRWISWDEVQSISGSPVCVVRPSHIPGMASVPFWSSKCPLWTPTLIIQTGKTNVFPTSYCDPLPSSPPLPESVIELGHWVHSNDDNFAFRVGTFHPYKVYLYPTQIDVDFVDVPDIADESPSLGLVATFAGGALGLGFSVTKLWS